MMFIYRRILLLVAVGSFVLSLSASSAVAERKQPVEVIQGEFLDGDPDYPTRALPSRGTFVHDGNSPDDGPRSPVRSRAHSMVFWRLLWRVAWIGCL
jgi:hypothetical protein